MSKEQIKLLEEKISRAAWIASWRERNGFKDTAESMRELEKTLRAQLKELENEKRLH